MKVIAFILLLAAFNTQAKEYVYAGGWSYHTSEHPKSAWQTHEPEASHKCWRTGTCITGKEYVDYDFNNDHHVIGYQKNVYLLAHFDNSFNQSTWLAARQFESAPIHHFSFLASVGITHGYTDCEFEDSGNNATTCPDVQVGIAFTKYKLQPVIATNGSVLTFSFRLEI